MVCARYPTNSDSLLGDMVKVLSMFGYMIDCTGIYNNPSCLRTVLRHVEENVLNAFGFESSDTDGFKLVPHFPRAR